jgi:uncharacterized protein (DUF924 family)
MEDSLRFEVHHQAIINRFDRYPQRHPGLQLHG